jgi:hypothetical protein
VRAARAQARAALAVATILGELRHHFRDAAWIGRPPRGLVELGVLVESERQKFGAALGPEPTVAELAARLDRPHAALSAAVEGHASRVALARRLSRHRRWGGVAAAPALGSKPNLPSGPPPAAVLVVRTSPRSRIPRRARRPLRVRKRSR